MASELRGIFSSESTEGALINDDTIDGISAALERGNHRRVLVIPGVELGARWNGDGQMHILGCYIDPEDSPLLGRLSSLRARRRERAKRIVSRLRALGAPISWDRVAQFADVYPCRTER